MVSCWNILMTKINSFSFTECQISTHPPESIFIELRIVGESTSHSIRDSLLFHNKFHHQPHRRSVMNTDLIMIMRKRC
jgi:hypothetical protein